MATFNRYNSLPETLPNKEFALVKVSDGFKWYVGDENNLPVPLSRAVDPATAPNQPVPLEQMEEAIGEKRVTADIVTSHDLDWSKAVHVLTLIGDTELSDINLPQTDNVKVIELIVTGDFALTLPAYWTAKPSNDDYSGTVENHIVVSCINGNSGSEKVIYSLENLA